MRDLSGMYLETSIEAPSGRVFHTTTGVSLEECEFIRAIIKADPSIKRTIEIGCALGFSSVAICDALAEREHSLHTIVDPFQSRGWERLGVSNVEKHGLTNFELIEEGSEFALPELAKKAPESYDLVFIDGMHTFDHTLIDLFYADRLVRKGGYIILDDTSWPAVAKAAAYFSKYPNYEVATKVPRGEGVKAKVAAGIAQLGKSQLVQALPIAASQKVYEFTFGTMVAWRKTETSGRSPEWFSSF